MSAHIYVGVNKGSIKRTVFKCDVTPTVSTHGERFSAVIGPFRTMRAAQIMALFGSGNPHLQHVLDAERLANEIK